MNILILVCAITVAAPDCQKDTAIDIFYAPPPADESLSFSGCARQGMLYAAESRLVRQGNYAKVVCQAGAGARKLAKASS
jgi:hypothetical protein